MLPEKLAFVDLETTGGRIHTDRVIEVGIVRIEQNKIVATYNQLLDPQCPIPPMIATMTGITDDMVAKAPTFRQCYETIEELLQDCIFVAHNARFDYSFLKQEFLRENAKFSPKHFCTVKLAKKLFPKMPHHDLSSIITAFDIVCENRHRAFDDAKVLWDFYQLLQERFSEEVLAEAITTIAKQPSLPIHLAKDYVTGLPESAGVYVFYGQEDMPLYVGKSINVRARVLSHFATDYASPTEMQIAQQTKRIEVIQTCGELGALLRESETVKTLKPLYNRKLRMTRELVVLEKTTGKEGYQSVMMQTVERIDATRLANICGVFKSKSQAKKHILAQARRYNLCQKLLGVEHTTTSCFAYRLGTCNGACVGSEETLRYNMRFAEAFSEAAIKPWPFAGPILLVEHDKKMARADAFLIDQWCLLFADAFDADFDDAEQEIERFLHAYERDNGQAPLYFDVDSYKIMTSFLNQPKNRLLIYDLSKKYQPPCENATSPEAFLAA